MYLYHIVIACGTQRKTCMLSMKPSTASNTSDAFCSKIKLISNNWKVRLFLIFPVACFKVKSLLTLFVTFTMLWTYPVLKSSCSVESMLLLLLFNRPRQRCKKLQLSKREKLHFYNTLGISSPKIKTLSQQ